MEIKENKIVIDRAKIGFEMSFDDIRDQLKSKFAFPISLDADGFGIFQIKRQECYGLKGKCSLVFSKGRLSEVCVILDWRMYRREKKTTLHGLSVAQAVKQIYENNTNELLKHFKLISETEKGKVFAEGPMTIKTGVDKDESSCVLSIVQAKDRCEDPT